jgi:hypothetical protein
VKNASGRSPRAAAHDAHRARAWPQARTVTGVEGAKDGQSASFIEHLTNTGYQTDSYSVVRNWRELDRRGVTQRARHR